MPLTNTIAKPKATLIVLGLLLFACLLFVPGQAQDTLTNKSIVQAQDNPFALPGTEKLTQNQARRPVPNETATVKGLADTSKAATAYTGNPFALTEEGTNESANPFAIPAKSETTTSSAEQLRATRTKRRFQLPALSITLPPSAFDNVLFYFLLMVTALLTLIVSVWREGLRKEFHVFGSLYAALAEFRTRTFVISPFRLVLMILFCCSGGVVLFLFARHQGWLLGGNPYHQLLTVIAALFAILLLRRIGYHLLAAVLPFGEVIKFFDFQMMNAYHVLAVIFLPLAFIGGYVAPDVAGTVLIASVSLLGLAALWRDGKVISAYGQLIAFNKFHFLVYLCAVEVAPVLILLKLVSKTM